MTTVYIPESSLAQNTQGMRQLMDMPYVVCRYGQGYPDSVGGMWIEKDTPAHTLAVMLNFKILT